MSACAAVSSPACLDHGRISVYTCVAHAVVHVFVTSMLPPSVPRALPLSPLRLPSSGPDAVPEGGDAVRGTKGADVAGLPRPAKAIRADHGRAHKSRQLSTVRIFISHGHLFSLFFFLSSFSPSSAYLYPSWWPPGMTSVPITIVFCPSPSRRPRGAPFGSVSAHSAHSLPCDSSFLRSPASLLRSADPPGSVLFRYFRDGTATSTSFVDHFPPPRSSQPTPHAPCDPLCLVPMLIGVPIGAWNPML